MNTKSSLNCSWRLWNPFWDLSCTNHVLLSPLLGSSELSAFRIVPWATFSWLLNIQILLAWRRHTHTQISSVKAWGHRGSSGFLRDVVKERSDTFRSGNKPPERSLSVWSYLYFSPPQPGRNLPPFCCCSPRLSLLWAVRKQDEFSLAAFTLTCPALLSHSFPILLDIKDFGGWPS